MNYFSYLLFSIILLALFCYSCNSDSGLEIENEIVTTKYHCDAEVKDGEVFKGDGHVFSNAGSQSADYSKSGKFSCKTNENQSFALALSLSDIKKGEIIYAEIWAYNPTHEQLGKLIISDDEAKQYNYDSYPIEKNGGWSLLANKFVALSDYKSLKVYGFNAEANSVYYDDLNVTRMSSAPKPELSDSTLRIFIPPVEYSQLDSFLVQGRKEDVLRKELKKYVKGFILEKGDSIPIRLRLKGDWTDHLKTEKFSLRIKVKGDHAFKGLKTFSIQSPETRGMMLEWYIHQLCKEEDLLTTRYEFVNVEINGEIKGVYALEEHFDKQLLEARNRREGPIIKIDEEGLWENRYDPVIEAGNKVPPVFVSSSIIPFKKNRTYKNPTLFNQFLVAQSHLNRYKNLEADSRDFVNVEAFAKYIAILDLGNSRHAQIWHNQRQYYNPVTAKLEPVLYDCFELKRHSDLRPFYMMHESMEKKSPEDLNLALLRDPDFRDFYAKFLLKMGNIEYIERFNSSHTAAINSNIELLSYEYPFYNSKHVLGFFKNNAAIIESKKDELLEFLKNFKSVSFKKETWEVYNDTLDFFTPSIALKAHLEYKGDNEQSIQLRNFHQSAIQVIAYSTDSLPNELIQLENSVSFKAFVSDYESKFISLPSDAKYLHYTANNLGERIVRVKISKWPFPQDINVLGEFTDLKKYKTQNIIMIPSGDYSFSQNVVADDAEKLIINAGTTIDLTNSAGFISYIPVELKGTKENPIHIYSSDSTASGFNVFAENGHSTLSHVRFTGLSAMNKNHWILTGAVTLYGGSVDIDNCVFENNHSEDGLNIIRSNFTMDNCTVSNTPSDGFDADFCMGTLSNSVFYETNNDALDFSGSQIEVKNCNIKNVGDKGISGGENSQLSISDSSIENAAIGIAAKDFSQLTVNYVNIEKCPYSYAAFRKKPEYGPASITVVSDDTVDEKMLIDYDSKITINSITTTGKEKLDIDSLYLGQ